MNQPSFSSRRILRPVRPWFIWLSMLVALLLNLMPLGRTPMLPDWVALVLCFWCVREPLRAGMGAGFVFGLLMDIGYGSLMGQHALAYVLLAYTAGTFSRRILWFGPLQQSLHVLPMLVGTQLVMLFVRLSTDAEFPGLGYFAGSVIATLLWYPISFVLLLPQYRPEDKDENRPI
ncbi:rod shape-determining protein MreD [Methyloversatilis sp.]|uniref:rod shape-determining protein MreD n=1 Tax=Methyloversatilis sp. TaxID=2569862 RepID=UPI002732AA2F|nr:rod shape-determining protein MreD [Methyloversatilis sp.]MDP2868222.1 rod shape-determining protein MreD [Methyloversatilis sp.]MDP3286977.1 rod shape-determining protein MreD [Methyloversatilis sp.]MDP3456167.1 rod shape-determining protein MreD [Methyloversatilis sp.]MDP3577420.1 rod shape-determining protein MreD [Methyloversatilis sp.]